MQFFISYSRKDHNLLEIVKNHLNTTYGDNCVWDDRKIEGGTLWEKKINVELKRCDIVICLLSDDFIKSKYCLYELQRATILRKNIIPILIHPITLNLPAPLQEIQYIDMTIGANWEASAELHAAVYRYLNVNKKNRPVIESNFLQATGISRTYPNRDSAGEDIVNDLLAADAYEIRISGISLNDFLDDKGRQYKNWQRFKEHLRRYDGDKPIVIKILIIHPLTYGAQLREWGEVRDGEVARLTYDIDRLTPNLERLATELNQKGTKVTVEIRMYLTAPMLFLVHTNNYCYMQQYYFWPTRKSNVENPVFRYSSATPENSFDDMHGHMKAHFDWIWEKASVPTSDYFHSHQVGGDQGIGRSGIVNIFTQPSDGKKRMLYLLRNAQKRVFIQGISLHTFFQNDEPITETIRDLVHSKKGIDIKILLLDPECDQAIFRSYREYCIRAGIKPAMSFSRYQEEAHDPNKSDSYHRKQSELYLHTMSSKNILMDINSIAQDINKDINSNAQEKPTLFEFKFYDCAPGSFVLIVDDHVLVEQYHFGKLQRQNQYDNILGKEMPLVEYVKDAESIFNKGTDGQGPEYQHRDPYRLIEDHLKFVLENFSWPATLPREAKSLTE